MHLDLSWSNAVHSWKSLHLLIQTQTRIQTPRIRTLTRIQTLLPPIRPTHALLAVVAPRVAVLHLVRLVDDRRRRRVTVSVHVANANRVRALHLRTEVVVAVATSPIHAHQSLHVVMVGIETCIVHVVTSANVSADRRPRHEGGREVNLESIGGHQVVHRVGVSVTHIQLIDVLVLLRHRLVVLHQQ